MLKLFDEFVFNNYSAIVSEGIELDNTEYQKITVQIQELAITIKSELPESAYGIFMLYSDLMTERVTVSSGLYYKRGFTDGIKLFFKLR